MNQLFIFWWIFAGLGGGLVLYDFNEQQGEWASIAESTTLSRANSEFSIQNGHLRYRGAQAAETTESNQNLAIQAVQKEIDLSSYDGILLRVKGDGKTYALDLASLGQPNLRHLQYRFETTGEWQLIKIPFEEILAPENMGYGMKASEVDWAELNVIGFVIDKGQAGSFELLIDEIGLY